MAGNEQERWPLPRNFLRSCVLLLLREESAHGYELLQRLRPLGFVRDDPGGLYRALRALEDEGLVRSSWDESGTGPDRRVYRVTRAGAEELNRSAQSLANVRGAVDAFLDRSEELAKES
jgi:PadR family transcriptional regulator, regulatory protein PadR